MPSPTQAAKRAALAGAILAALLGGGAAAGVVDHETIRSGDTVLGDILAPSDIDVYDFEAPRGAVVVLDARPAAPGNWRAQSIGVLDHGYTQVIGSVGTSPTTVRTSPLPGSGTWHLAVGAAEDRLGGYRVRFSVAPARQFSTQGRGSAVPPPFVIGAPAGADLTVALAWNGAKAVTLDPAAGITGPDGSVLTSASAPKRVKSTWRQTGFRTTTLGDHAIRFAVPTGTRSWRATISVKPPKPGRGRTRDLRTDGAPAAHTLLLVEGGSFAAIRVAGESGGPNDVLLLPTNPNLGQGSVHPVAIASDGRGGVCSLSPLEIGSPPGSYRFVCNSGSTADMHGVVRSGDRIVAFEAPLVRSPAGTGSVSVSGIVYDADLQVTAFSETRTFDITGHTHTLEVSAIERRADGRIIAYTVAHTGPGGSVRTYDYALVQTR